MQKDNLNSLLVRISTLPDRGHCFESTLDLESLNARMTESESNDIEFITPPEFSITLRRTPFGAEGFGDVSARFHQNCSRCLDPHGKAIEIDCKLIVKERPSPDSIEDDVALIYSDDDTINLTDYIEELIILKLDTYWYPELDASGACGLCGLKANQKEEEPESSSPNSMNNLLQQALEKNKKK